MAGGHWHWEPHLTNYNTSFWIVHALIPSQIGVSAEAMLRPTYYTVFKPASFMYPGKNL